MFGENTNWGKVADMRKSAFLPSQEDNVLAVHIIWGLKEQDRSDCHMTDYKCKGRTVFDNSFDMNPPPCQTALLVSFVSTHIGNIASYLDIELRGFPSDDQVCHTPRFFRLLQLSCVVRLSTGPLTH